MITITPATSADCAAVAQLWNAKTLDAGSCWYQAAAVDAPYVAGLLAAGYAIRVARVDGAPAGFGFWCGPAASPRLIALAADLEGVYYRLMAEFCAWGVGLGAARGFAEIGTRPTTEKARMDALEVITYTAIGYEPMAAEGPAGERVPKLLRAECDLSVLSRRLGEMPGGAP